MEDFSASQNGRLFSLKMEDFSTLTVRWKRKGLTFETEDSFVLLERKESQLQHSEIFLSFQIERFSSFDAFRTAHQASQVQLSSKWKILLSAKPHSLTLHWCAGTVRYLGLRKRELKGGFQWKKCSLRNVEKTALIVLCQKNATLQQTVGKWVHFRKQQSGNPEVCSETTCSWEPF